MVRRRDEAIETLAGALARRTGEGALGALYERLEGGKVRCFACGHRCLIPEGRDGICRVRFNRGGTLLVPRGYVAALQVDPIEKKPFFHALPGAPVLSFGMLGCDLHCSFCHNWVTSQALRDPAAVAPLTEVEPGDLVALAERHGAPVMVSTYNEPLITSEWAVEVFTAAKERGIVCGYVSNGNATPEVLRWLRPYVDLYKVDLKGFSDRGYRELGCTLENVLASIRLIKEMGFWLELVTLLIPGFNDSEAELRDLTAFVASVAIDIPWHVTAYRPAFKMKDPRATTPADLVRAAAIGREAGLRYVYAGNLPGEVGDLENTRCPTCGTLLIERRGHEVLSDALRAGGRCGGCGMAIAGYWTAPGAAARGAPAGRYAAGSRMPRKDMDDVC